MDMDRVRKLVFPVLLTLMAGLAGVLGNFSTEDGRALATAAAGKIVVEGAVAPHAEAEARRRMLVNRAHQARMEGMVMFGAASLMLAGAIIIVLANLRTFRGPSMARPGPGAAPPAP